MNEESIINQKEEFSVLKKIEFNPSFIFKIRDPTDNEMDLALELNPESALMYENLSEGLQGFLVENNPENIKYIVNPTKKVEKYVAYRGFLDFKNGNYYWKKAEKKPNSLSVKMQIHPFIGIPSVYLLRFSLFGFYIYAKIAQLVNWAKGKNTTT